MYRRLALASSLLAVASAQQVGTNTAEVHPKLPTQKCTGNPGVCTTQQTSIVLDSNWRWVHFTGGYNNCYTGNTWACTGTGLQCAQQCALEGADYSGTYGITTSGNALTLKFVTGSNVGSRVYLLQDDDHYFMLKLKNQEFTFDVDMSNLGCGLNGALYFSEMLADGGKSQYASNAAGARYGTGYCDSQCPHDIKFISGEANIDGWTGSPNDPNAGAGKYGSCCSEMDIWEANKNAAAYTPHPCTVTGPYRCSGNDCGDDANRYGGVCDKDGCDFNSWRMGNQDFLGPGKTINTNSKFTVVTQFITDDGTANGELVEIRRIYVQNGQVIANSNVNIPGIPVGNSITDSFCQVQKTVFGDTNSFADKGGLSKMGDALANGMVLVMSVWDDHAANMLWLDSNYPTDGDPSKPGISRGPCATTSGVPTDVESQAPNSSVTFSNIKWGDLGSTFVNNGPSSSSSVRTTSTSSVRTASSSSVRTTSSSTHSSSSSTRTSSSARPSQSLVPQWGQCGGINWTGGTVCQSPYTCHYLNDWYYQCY